MWTITLVVVLSVILAALLVPVGLYFLVMFLAKRNIFFTIVEQGWRRIVLRFGKYHKTLRPGFRWIGIPLRDRLYVRKMEFLKAVTKQDGTVLAEVHRDAEISSFKATWYPYALPFKDEEDSRGLNLSGIAVVMSRMKNFRKALFVTSDWYATENMLIMPHLRDAITDVSYAEIIGSNVDDPSAEDRVKKAISKLLWESINAPQEDGKPSVVDELEQLYGIVVRSIEVASIDPPENWRAITLEPYKASQEAKAANYRSDAAAIKASVLSKMMDIEINKRVEASRPTPDQPPTLTRQQVEEALAASGEAEALRTQHLEALKLYESKSFEVIEDRTVLQGPNGQPLQLGDASQIVGVALAILRRWKGGSSRNDNSKRGGGERKGRRGKDGGMTDEDFDSI